MWKISGTYDWIIVCPGDWHLLKLAAETLRGVIKDRGFSDLARDCGFKKEVYQWRDINNMLLALCESFKQESILEWEDMREDGSSYNEFFTMQEEASYKDEVSRFWAKFDQYFHAYAAYYFAICSGNWDLRNSALPKLAEMFIAYSHDDFWKEKLLKLNGKRNANYTI